MGLSNYVALVTRETPFRLTYGVEAVIPIEIGEITWRTTHPSSLVMNKQAIREELDLVEEVRDQAFLQETVIKWRMMSCFNYKKLLFTTEGYDTSFGENFEENPNKELMNLAILNTVDDPITYEEALMHEVLRKAIDSFN